jgi:superfamily I DNA/RNA helicase
MERIWSNYQKAIFENVKNGSGHTIIMALAGSSKSSSLVESSKYLNPNAKSLFCAFNKDIAMELQGKLPEYVTCSTLHSLGLKEIKRKCPKTIINNKKSYDIVSNMWASNEEFDSSLIFEICKCIEYCKNTLKDVPKDIEEFIYTNDIDTGEMEIDKFISYVTSGLRISKETTSVIDFTDMIWFPFVYNLHAIKYDNVFIDECQDLNVGQIELAIGAVKKGGRFFAVGDRNQAIYLFRQADSKIFDKLRARLSPQEFTLPICYRCPKKVIELAKKFVPDIEAFEHAIDGEVENTSYEKYFDMIKPGDMVLSRKNAPLVSNCMKALRRGIPSNIIGRDLGEGLKSLVKKSKKRDIDSLLAWLNNWRDKEVKRLQLKDPQADLEVVTDKYECLKAFCEEAKSVKQLIENIDKLFAESDRSKIVSFSSVHRSKGMEADNVYLFTDTFRASSQEEKNIKYVAVTRAKKKLVFVKKSYSEETKNVIDF